MEPFKELSSHAALLDVPNVDTDQIIPKQFLKRVERTGFGQFLFYDWRFKDDGSEDPSFSLNKTEQKGAAILLARDNFGCGSSREHAPWALLDYGFKCIIAPSYADIFFNNCYQNGMLPVRLSSAEVDELFKISEKEPSEKFKIDLVSQTISAAGKTFKFDIDPEKKNKLLNGLDDIAGTEKHDAAIAAYEKSRPFY